MVSHTNCLLVLANTDRKAYLTQPMSTCLQSLEKNINGPRKRTALEVADIHWCFGARFDYFD
jgi:hypothetical protein